MISVVIPAYNEEDAIYDTVHRVRVVLANCGLHSAEVLVVDDGSSDRTLERALAAGALAVRHPHNLGYGKSLKTGILRAHHDAIVIVDADLTYPVESLPQLLEKYNEGFDMVVGARTGDYYRESVVKERLRLLLKFLVEFTAGRKIPDINSGFRLFSRSAVLKHIDHLCDTFSFTTSLTLAYMMTGKCVVYIPIDYARRQGKTKVKLFRDSLRTLQYIVQAITYYNPLKIFVLLSAACLLAAIPCLAIGCFTGSLFFNLIGCSFIVMCGLVFGMGLLADLVKQIGVSLRMDANTNSQPYFQQSFSAAPPNHSTQTTQVVKPAQFTAHETVAK